VWCEARPAELLRGRQTLFMQWDEELGATRPGIGFVEREELNRVLGVPLAPAPRRPATLF
jgi:hypothetical protein